VSVSIVIFTHGQVGPALIEVAEFILGHKLPGIRHIPFVQSKTHTTGRDELKTALLELDEGDGILVLTDLVGASPANLIAELLQDLTAIMVSGVNLAMLLRVCNYRDQSLADLARTAAEGGKRSIEVFKS